MSRGRPRGLSSIAAVILSASQRSGFGSSRNSQEPALVLRAAGSNIVSCPLRGFPHPSPFPAESPLQALSDNPLGLAISGCLRTLRRLYSGRGNGYNKGTLKLRGLRPRRCGSGGIGRRVSLRSLWPQGCEGSSPSFRTISLLPPRSGHFVSASSPSRARSG